MHDEAGGFLLFLFESFAARALLGSLVAVALVEVLLRRDIVRSAVGRRRLLLVPFAAAALLAVASVDRGFLPNVWIDTDRITDAGALLDVLGDVEYVGGSVDLLVALYLSVVAALVVRRLAGVLRARALRRHSRPAPRDVRRQALPLALAAGVNPPEVRLVADCPGGAFTAGIRRPWIALDPTLVATLDIAELQALIAHEVAHIRRRDPLLTLLTGLGRDLVFFLPGIHLATFWLRQEQEEAADDLAARSTRRPGALASTILKVWEAQTGRLGAVSACAAAAPLTLQWPLFGRQRAAQSQSPHVMVRVQRLISPLQALTHRRTRRDFGLPIVVLTLAVSVAMVLPAWLTRVLHNDGVLMQFSAGPGYAAVESPAFATFRAMAPVATPSVGTGVGTGIDSAIAFGKVRPAAGSSLCPCVETAAQLRAGRSASSHSSVSHLVWSSDGREAWQLRRLHEQARLRVDDQVITLRGGQREVGLFTVTRNHTLRSDDVVGQGSGVGVGAPATQAATP